MEYLRAFCCRRKRPEQETKDVNKLFQEACNRGDIVTVKKCVEESALLKNSISLGFISAVENNYSNVADFLAKLVNEECLSNALKISCERHRGAMVQVLLDNGANPRVGLRFTKASDTNIFNMLYRKLLNSQNIN